MSVMWQYGHTVQICYHRFDISFQGGQNSSQQTPSTQAGMTAMVASPSTIADEAWFLDFGASHHLTKNGCNLNSKTPYTGTDGVNIGNGKKLSISSFGSSNLVSNSHSFKLHKVFHVPFISANLISAAKFCSDNNSIIEFHPNSFLVKDQCSKRCLLKASLKMVCTGFLS